MKLCDRNSIISEQISTLTSLNKINMQVHKITDFTCNLEKNYNYEKYQRFLIIPTLDWLTKTNPISKTVKLSFKYNLYNIMIIVKHN